MTEYEKRGYANREAYLYWLAITHGLPVKQVTNCARSLGEDEDFGDDFFLHAVDPPLLGVERTVFADEIVEAGRSKVVSGD